MQVPPLMEYRVPKEKKRLTVLFLISTAVFYYKPNPAVNPNETQTFCGGFFVCPGRIALISYKWSVMFTVHQRLAPAALCSAASATALSEDWRHCPFKPTRPFRAIAAQPRAAPRDTPMAMSWRKPTAHAMSPCW